MEKLKGDILRRTQEVLYLDKKMKHNGFMGVLEKDMRNLLETYFSTDNSSLVIKLEKGELGKLNLCVVLEDIKPKKIGINA